MPVQIGATTHDFSNPTGLLSDCHRRVEMFLGSLNSVANVADCQLTDETRRSLELALRYFREAAPKHTADEEESLFPRLRKIADPAIEAALRQMAELENDHRWAEPLHKSVDELGQKFLIAGSLTAEDQSPFRRAISELIEMYRRHIEFEDQVLFPIAARVLPKKEQEAVAREMAERRKIQFAPIAHVRES